jgi:hypothetical protein
MGDEIRSKPLNNPSRVMEGKKEGSDKLGNLVISKFVLIASIESGDRYLLM